MDGRWPGISEAAVTTWICSKETPTGMENIEVYTIGFSKKSAAQFFGTLKKAGIQRLVDIRLNNVSQLAGFTKKGDLEFFLREICGIEYIYEPLLAPTQDIIDDYRKKKGAWADFQMRFLKLIAQRRIEDEVSPRLFSVPTVLLCSEATATQCHRRLVLEYLNEKWGNLKVVHL